MPIETHSSAASILVVEDEPFIRIIAADTLADCGFKVLEAADAREALSMLEEHPEVALIFTDINMPGEMDGLGLARYVARERPEIKVVLTSGKQWLEPSQIPDRGVFLAKPYRSTQLTDVVSRQLQA